jgi:hypothetical protein
MLEQVALSGLNTGAGLCALPKLDQYPGRQLGRHFLSAGSYTNGGSPTIHLTVPSLSVS